MPARKIASTGPIYQLKVTLQETRPPIWRRLQVDAHTTLPQLHDILQVAMGWTDSHLHRFFVGGVDYGQPEPGFDALVCPGMVTVTVPSVPTLMAVAAVGTAIAGSRGLPLAVTTFPDWSN